MSLTVYIRYGCIKIFLLSDISLFRKNGCYDEKFVSSVSIMPAAVVFVVSILCQFCVNSVSRNSPKDVLFRVSKLTQS